MILALVLVPLLFVSVLLVFRSKRSPLWFLLVSSLIWFTVRFGFGRMYTTFDEAYYLSTVKVGGVYSGLLTPLLLRVSNRFLHNPILSLFLLSFMIFSVYPVLLFKFYKSAGAKHPLLSLLVLFVSSYYIWTANAFRPQQLGILFGLLVLVIHWRRPRPAVLFIEMALAWVLLMLAHILSFFMFYAIVIVLSSVDYAFEGKDIRRPLAEILSAFPAFLLFLKLPWYSETVYSIKWMLKHSSISVVRAAGWNFSWVFLLVFLSLTAVPFLFRELAGLFIKIRRWTEGRKTTIFVTLMILSFAGLFAQFWLGRAVYMNVYRSAFYFFLMQAGNLFFAIALLYTLVQRLGRWERFEKGTAVLLGVGAASLVISFFMPSGYGSFGFRNWTVRVLQYLVFLAAPPVADFTMSLLSARRNLLRLGVVVMIAAFTVFSVLNVARPPEFYSYPYYWTAGDLKLIEHAGPGFVYTSRGAPENSVVLSFLGWAYGFRIVTPDRPPSHPCVCVGSLCYAPFPYYGHELPISVSQRSLELVTGKMPLRMKGLASSILGSEGFRISSDSDTVLILGNSSTSPYIKSLQLSYMVPVTVNFSVITGPDFVIYHAIHAGRRPCDSWMAYFVIQSVEINGSHIILIEGPNYDSVFAGLWWFVHHAHANYSYAVGVWREKDERVLKPLSCGVHDRNGFSFGDEVRIVLEEGVGSACTRR